MSCRRNMIVTLFVLLVEVLPLINAADFQEENKMLQAHTDGICYNCRGFLTETIPEKMTFAKGTYIGNDTTEMWTQLLNELESRRTESNVELAAFYWTLLAEDMSVKEFDGKKMEAWMKKYDTKGRKIFVLLQRAGAIKHNIRIAQNLDPKGNRESQLLHNKNQAIVRSLNFSHWYEGPGVMHSKMWITDNANFYLGSANMDWRSLSQIKELGITVFGCQCLTKELKTIFEILFGSIYSYGKRKTQINYDHVTEVNATRPLKVYLNGVLSLIYFATSPDDFCPRKGENDLSAIRHVMTSAKRFVYISVMTYAPEIMYERKKKYWPEIDNIIKTVIYENNVEVRLLISQWKHSMPNLKAIVKSLLSFNCLAKKQKLKVKLFTVPSFDKEQAKIPLARVNHAKYMVTDKALYIGTSNWAGDYFTSSHGVSIVIFQNYSLKSYPKKNEKNLVHGLRGIFLRDWNSKYAKPINYNCCCGEKQPSKDGFC